MKLSKLKLNVFYQFLYQCIILVLPLITAPYVTRVLGSDSLGIYTYNYSLANYFVIFAMLGIQNYGCRLIAKSKDEEDKSKRFWSLFFMHFLLSLFSTIIYLLFCFYVFPENKIVFLILIFYVISSLFDVTWFFYGTDNVKKVLLKNFIIKMLELIFIFIFVKSPDDLRIYTLIMACSIFLGQISLLPFVLKSVKFYKPSLREVFVHIKPLLILSISVFGSNLPALIDKTLLGVLANNSAVAYFEYTNKIVSIPYTIIAGLGPIFLSNISKLIANNETEKIEKKIRNTFLLYIFFSCATSFGVAAVSNVFSVIYYGADFEVTGNYMMALSPIIILSSLGNVLRAQYLLPMGRDKDYIICSFTGNLVNVVFASCLIPFINVYGAIIGSLVGELTNLILLLVYTHKNLPLNIFIKDNLPFFGFGIIMFSIVKPIDLFFEPSFLVLFIEVISGASIYLVLSFLYIRFFKKDVKENLLGGFRRGRKKD